MRAHTRATRQAEAAIDKRDADRLRDRNIVQEHVLCAIKFHKKGSLEVRCTIMAHAAYNVACCACQLVRH